MKTQETPKIIQMLVETFQPEMKTIRDIIPMTKFYFVRPTLSRADFDACISANFYPVLKTLTIELINAIDRPAPQLEELIKTHARTQHITLKEVYRFLRLCLMGETQGPGIRELLKLLPPQEVTTRLSAGVALLN
jgi:lysyl-tRNA synthetase class I